MFGLRVELPVGAGGTEVDSLHFSTSQVVLQKIRPQRKEKTK